MGFVSVTALVGRAEGAELLQPGRSLQTRPATLLSRAWAPGEPVMLGYQPASSAGRGHGSQSNGCSLLGRSRHSLRQPPSLTLRRHSELLEFGEVSTTVRGKL